MLKKLLLLLISFNIFSMEFENKSTKIINPETITDTINESNTLFNLFISDYQRNTVFVYNDDNDDINIIDCWKISLPDAINKYIEAINLYIDLVKFIKSEKRLSANFYYYAADTATKIKPILNNIDFCKGLLDDNDCKNTEKTINKLREEVNGLPTTSKILFETVNKN